MGLLSLEVKDDQTDRAKKQPQQQPQRRRISACLGHAVTNRSQNGARENNQDAEQDHPPQAENLLRNAIAETAP
ncbi:MAG: hypothetical protein IT384_33880 [Deltaproteobacteria bacterium]|nr:hypothetical protein [Deltaproteobacteria bacterium]